MDRRRATISSLSVLILGVILFFVACTHASDTVEMCSYISELNELQISVECLETVAGFEHYYYLGPREFMAKLQRVERRVKKRRWLTEEEDLLWVMVRDKMRTMVLEGITREFLPKSGMPATCAIVRALGFRYGFCTYLYLIGLTSDHDDMHNDHDDMYNYDDDDDDDMYSEHYFSARIFSFFYRSIFGKGRTKNTTKPTPTPTLTPTPTVSPRTRIKPKPIAKSFGNRQVTLVVHLNLFNMECNPAALQALCSEYVRFCFFPSLSLHST